MNQELNTSALNEQNSQENLPEKIQEESISDYQDYSAKSLMEIIEIFQQMLDRADQQELYKNADIIKAAFYKVLKKEKIAVGFHYSAETGEVNEEESEENLVSNNPFAELERGFKELYQNYKTMRSSFIQNIEKQKEDNLKIKLEIIDELKALLEKQEDLNHTFPAFRELQNRWKATGPVPQSSNKDVWENYQFSVEKFYDFVKINNELRDLDLKKNLEIKSDLCVKAEELIEENNVVDAFRKLQKLHEEWRELGPVPKELREEIWERFKKATSAINKRQQEFFERLKEDQRHNLELKANICEKAEDIAALENIDGKDWNNLSKQIENLQSEWKNIGFASRKENQRIYDRFRAACDKFYNAKRDYYSGFKVQMQDNLDKKNALCEQAEALKSSTDWKKTTDQLISLQKKWKEIGPVARKQSDAVWKRFRAACDEFFENKSKHFSSVDESYEENLKRKLELIQEITDYKPDSKTAENIEALKDFQARWSELGFVPIKEKERVQAAYRHAIDSKFADIRSTDYDHKIDRYKKHIKELQNSGRGDRGVRSERDKLVQKFRQMENDIAVWENNMGFFAKSKNADALLLELDKKIARAKEELAQIEEKIKVIDNQQ
ncbi:MAG: DUF349 domain-containing protein [Bacteroidales bacterium]|jgi:hypothetical protein|nr:DUF349 domain-containing protein [Bacteroidales bacterium]